MGSPRRLGRAERDPSGRGFDLANRVTAVLASYRGYDTLGETVVIFTAAIGVLLLIGGARRSVRKDGDE